MRPDRITSDVTGERVTFSTHVVTRLPAIVRVIRLSHAALARPAVALAKEEEPRPIVCHYRKRQDALRPLATHAAGSARASY